MADPKFHTRGAALKLKDIAGLAGAALEPDADPAFVIEDVGPLNSAEKNHLSFLDNAKYRGDLKTTKAGACILRQEEAALAPKGIHLLISDNPYKAYALAARALYPQGTTGETRIAKSASIDLSAKLGKGCVVEEGAVIGPNVVIGERSRIGANAVITHAIIGDHVNIYPGVCIGQDGFGFVPDPKGYLKIPQLGRVIIGDNVEIGANSCIDRGSGADTVIGAGTWIDNLVHVAHNVKIGKGCILAGQVGIAGSAIIEDFVVMGGQAGIGGHITVGKGARISGQAGVISDVPPGAEYMGFPARPRREFLKSMAFLNRLIKRDKSL